jgi:Sulfatase
VIPQDAKLIPWPDKLLKQWDSLTPEEKKLFIRQADVYGAYLAYTDHEIGRVIQAVEDLGKLDNTLIIYISGDNGASAEGSPNGTPSEVLQLNGIELPVKERMKWYDVWGSDQTYNHFAIPWSWTFDTPYKWVKQIPSFFGGTRQGMAISWPARIKDNHMGDPAPLAHEAGARPQEDRRRRFGRAAALRIGGGLLQFPCGGRGEAAIRPLLKLIRDPLDQEIAGEPHRRAARKSSARRAARASLRYRSPLSPFQRMRRVSIR